MQVITVGNADRFSQGMQHAVTRVARFWEVRQYKCTRSTVAEVWLYAYCIGNKAQILSKC